MWPQSSAIASAVVEAYLSLLGGSVLLAVAYLLLWVVAGSAFQVASDMGLLHEALSLTGGCLSIVARRVVACNGSPA